VTAAPARFTEERVHSRRWWTLAVLCLSLLIVVVGNSSLNVTLPTLARDLDATNSQLQWVVAIYSLVFAGMLFTSGALGDRYGRKGALQLGLLIFLAAAIAATLSSSMWQLIACRAVMGLGASFIMPSTLSILVNVFPVHERAKAIAIWASITGAAGALGPVASGFLLEHFWWGSVFLINVPILLLALVAGWFLVPSSRDPHEAPLDPMGAGLSILGLGTLVYGLVEAAVLGWTDPLILTVFGVAAILLVSFVMWERRAPNPMLDMSYFRNPAFSVGTGGMVLTFFALYGNFFMLTQYFQLVLGFSPLGTALRTLPYAVMMLSVSPFTPRFVARIGAHRTVALGMLLSATGLLLFMFSGLHTPYAMILLAIVAMSGGMALCMSPMTASIMSAVPRRRAGAGSATNDATRELGASLGVAVLGSILSSRYASGVDSLLGGLSSADQALAHSSLAGAAQVAATLPAQAGHALLVGAQEAFLNGFHVSLFVAAMMAITASILVYRYLPHRLSHEALPDETPLTALEETAELALGGVLPITAEGVVSEPESQDVAVRRADVDVAVDHGG
jgi:EmrB/QacA subfamily drug resistance transporter